LIALLTHRPRSHAGAVWDLGGAHCGIGHGLPPLHSAIRAWIASAAFFVTARGVQSIGQQAPAATEVNAQSSSLAQGASSEAATSPAAPRWTAAASEAVIGPDGADAGGVAGFAASGPGRSGAALDGALEAPAAAPGGGAPFDREAQPHNKRPMIRARMPRGC